MTPQELRDRTREFAVAVIHFSKTLTADPISLNIVRQLTRSAASVGANYRAVCRARSRADFISKLGVVIEEADEANYWLELAGDEGLCQPSEVAALKDEAHQLTRILTRSRETARAARNRKSPNGQSPTNPQ